MAAVDAGVFVDQGLCGLWNIASGPVAGKVDRAMPWEGEKRRANAAKIRHGNSFYSHDDGDVRLFVAQTCGEVSFC